MKTLVLALLVASSGTAFAKHIPMDLHHRAPQVPVTSMTCSQANHFAQTFGYVLESSPDGLLPIYPIDTSPADLSCGRYLVKPVVVHTKDQRDCVISWYCMSV
ncbi:MAG: hypothetical protein ACXVB9_18250 [Bdellovibrionota bacterium]